MIEACLTIIRVHLNFVKDVAAIENSGIQVENHITVYDTALTTATINITTYQTTFHIIIIRNNGVLCRSRSFCNRGTILAIYLCVPLEVGVSVVSQVLQIAISIIFYLAVITRISLYSPSLRLNLQTREINL